MTASHWPIKNIHSLQLSWIYPVSKRWKVIFHQPWRIPERKHQTHFQLHTPIKQLLLTFIYCKLAHLDITGIFTILTCSNRNFSSWTRRRLPLLPLMTARAPVCLSLQRQERFGLVCVSDIIVNKWKLLYHTPSGKRYSCWLGLHLQQERTGDKKTTVPTEVECRGWKEKIKNWKEKEKKTALSKYGPCAFQKGWNLMADGHAQYPEGCKSIYAI